jgi:hypothetical protein
MAVDFNIMSIVQRNMMTPQEQAQSLFLRPTRNPEVTPVDDPTFTPIAVIPTPYKASTYGVPQEPKLQQELLYERPPLQDYKPVSFLEKAANAIIPSAEAVEIPNKETMVEELLDYRLKKSGEREIPLPTNKSKVQTLLSDRGFSPEAQAAILGNIAVETGDSFDYQQKQKGGGKGYGLFQFDFMKPYYDKFLKDNNFEDSPTSQMDFMYETIYGSLQDLIGKGNAAKLRDSFQSKDVEQITKDFMNIWEKPGVPHEERRVKEALKFYSSQ